MPDVRRQPIATPILALILVAMPGSSGIACACALLALDTPAEAHHGMSHTPASAAAGEHDDCGSACGAHAATAVNSKAPIVTDYHPEKPAAPAANADSTTLVHASGLHGRRWYDDPDLPLSTPVSRSDILLD
jgi:hypothetical protein